MGLLDRITTEQDAVALATSSSTFQAEQMQRHDRSRISTLVNARLQRLAEAMDVELSLITAGDIYPRYGSLGDDVFFSVQPFNANETIAIKAGQEDKVLEEFRLDVLGLNLKTSRLQLVRVGTLRYVNYDCIARSIGTKPFEVSLDEVENVRQAVIKAAETRLVCGRPILYGAAGDDEINRLVVASSTSMIKRCLLAAGHSGTCDPDPAP